MKDYNDLSDSTKNRYASMLEKLHKSGFTTMEVRNFTGKELKNALQNKATIKTNEAYIRIIHQITTTIERKDKTVDLALDSYKKFGFKGRGLDKIEKELTKVSGNTYFAIVKRLQKDYKESEKKALIHARDILKLPKSHYTMLEQKEQLILADFDY